MVRGVFRSVEVSPSRMARRAASTSSFQPSLEWVKASLPPSSRMEALTGSQSMDAWRSLRKLSSSNGS